MYTVMGITGRVGGVVANSLLAAGHPVRGIVRDPRRAVTWAERGCELVQADIRDATALSSAFKDSKGVFILVPSSFDPSPDFSEAKEISKSLSSSLREARPSRVVYLSTVGAQAVQQNLLSQHTLIEKELNTLPTPLTYLRPAWFMENSSWDITPARENGVIQSFLQPLDKAFPMVATADIGQIAAELLQTQWSGHRVVELEGPKRITPNELAATFSKILGRPVRMEIVPRHSWEDLFRSQGMKNPMPRIRMLDGFNDGWIDFEGPPRKGKTSLETVLRSLVESSV